MAALPPDLRADLVAHFAVAMHPVFWIASAAAATAAALSLALRETPLEGGERATSRSSRP
jgi:hypothetical protein